MLQGVTHSKQTERIPQIIQQITQGRSKTQIAENLGVSRMQIWRDQHTPLYYHFMETWLITYEDKLNELLEDPQTHTQLEALKEIGRMIRSVIPKQSLSLHKSESSINIIVSPFHPMTPAIETEHTTIETIEPTP